MTSKQYLKLVKTAKSSNIKKSLQALEELESLTRSLPPHLRGLSRELAPLLESSNERVKFLASVIIRRESELAPKEMIKQFRFFLDVLEKIFTSKSQSSFNHWKPYTNIMFALSNIANEYPKLGDKISPVIGKALMYPLYSPQNPTKERALLYVTAVKTLGRIGKKNPQSVDGSIQHIYKGMVDSYQFDFWKKAKSDPETNMRLHAANTLKRIGREDPARVVPRVIPALNEKNKKAVSVGKDILLYLSKDIKSLLPALIKSMNSDKIDERERVTEFMVELGNKHPVVVMPILTRAVTDSRKNVRIQAISAMGSLLTNQTKYIPKVLPVLIKCLLEENDNEIKHSIADSIAIVSFLNINVFQKYMSHVIKFMNDDYYHVRWRMYQIIKNIGIFKPQAVVDTIPHLINGLTDPHGHVQDKAKEALAALKVNKHEYLQAIKYIASGTRALEKAKQNGIECMQGQNALMDAIKAAKEYKFLESISLSSGALDLMEASGVSLSRYDAASKYVSGPYIGVSGERPDIPSQPFGYRDVEDLPLPPPPEESIPLPPPAPESGQPSGGIMPAKEVSISESKKGFGIDEIFLMTTYGILIDHYVASKKSKVDEEILAGMLVAVKSFITDSFDLPDAVGGGKMHLNNIDFGDFSVILSSGKFLTMVAITTSGNKDTIYGHLTDGVSKIEEKYHGILKTWDGDMEALGDLPDFMKTVVLE